jgi:hypothetical protein
VGHERDDQPIELDFGAEAVDVLSTETKIERDQRNSEHDEKNNSAVLKRKQQ